MRFAFDLSNYDDVKSNAVGIHAPTVRRLPCDDAWGSGKIALFRQWMDEGLAP